MRITANMTADNSLYNIQQGRAKLDKLNEQIGSRNKISTARVTIRSTPGCCWILAIRSR